MRQSFHWGEYRTRPWRGTDVVKGRSTCKGEKNLQREKGPQVGACGKAADHLYALLPEKGQGEQGKKNK